MLSPGWSEPVGHPGSIVQSSTTEPVRVAALSQWVRSRPPFETNIDTVSGALRGHLDDVLLPDVSSVVTGGYRLNHVEGGDFDRNYFAEFGVGDETPARAHSLAERVRTLADRTNDLRSTAVDARSVDGTDAGVVESRLPTRQTAVRAPVPVTAHQLRAGMGTLVAVRTSENMTNLADYRAALADVATAVEDAARGAASVESMIERSSDRRNLVRPWRIHRQGVTVSDPQPIRAAIGGALDAAKGADGQLARLLTTPESRSALDQNWQMLQPLEVVRRSLMTQRMRLDVLDEAARAMPDAGVSLELRAERGDLYWRRVQLNREDAIGVNEVKDRDFRRDPIVTSTEPSRDVFAVVGPDIVNALHTSREFSTHKTYKTGHIDLRAPTATAVTAARLNELGTRLRELHDGMAGKLDDLLDPVTFEQQVATDSARSIIERADALLSP